MSNGQETWLWIGFAGMVLGALAIFAAGQRAGEDQKHHAVTSFFVCLIAAVSYFAMANGQAIVEVAGRTIYVPRYVDWLFTTPLLLLGLMMVGLPRLRQGEDNRERNSLVAGVIGADVVMIATGLFASLSSSDTTRYVWYIISCGAFLAVLGLIYGPVRAAAKAQGGNTITLFNSLVSILTVLWFIYPVLWLLGTEGLEVIGLTAEIAVFAIIDLTAKVGFGLLLVTRIAGAREPGEARSGRRTAEAATA